MPLSFPIASSARAALDAEQAVRTLMEARELAGAPVTLVSEWLRPTPAEREEIQGKADVGVARGFVQLYEDAKGRPVIAVTFWKPRRAEPAPAKGAAKAGRRGGAKADAAPPGEDHTDDLYFARPGSRTKKRRRGADPNQLDLFAELRRKDNESRDPHNPSVVIVEEEGDGAAFGLTRDTHAAATKDKA